MKKIILIALMLNFAACSTDTTETAPSPSAKVKESTFNPNPKPEDYAKDSNFIRDRNFLAESQKGSIKERLLPGVWYNPDAIWVRAYVPDPNFRQALIDAGAGEEDAILGDNYIYIDESRYCLQLAYISNRNITDATGIEAFKHLRILEIGSNKLTFLNVSALKKLTVLECNDNRITSLDLSANKKLSQIWCFNNELTHLTLPDYAENLWGLWCYNNKLTTLDFRKNNKLISLFLQENKLTTLNVKLLTLLNSINVSSNRFTTLNFDSNYRLEHLWCYENFSLTDLSIKNNNNFKITFQDFSESNKNLIIHVDASFLPNAKKLWGGDFNYKL